MKGLSAARERLKTCAFLVLARIAMNYARPQGWQCCRLCKAVTSLLSVGGEAALTLAVDA